MTGLVIFLLLVVLHVCHAAVGIGAEHLATQETQHGRLPVVTVHHVISTPDCRGEEEEGGGKKGESLERDTGKRKGGREIGEKTKCAHLNLEALLTRSE